MAKIVLPDKVRTELNQRLKDIADHKEELEKARKAGVPGVEPIIGKCEDCEHKIAAIKQHYFPGKK